LSRYVGRAAVAATMPALEVVSDRAIDPYSLEGRHRRNGRTAQVHVRVTAYTNGDASAEMTPSGTCSEPQSPSACGTQAKYLLPGRAVFERRKSKVAPPLLFTSSGCPVLRHRAPGVPIACRYTWRRGRGETPGVPHAPEGEMRDKETGFPRAGQTTEAMMRVWILLVARMERSEIRG
jgi:hypothetical protein